MSRVLLNNLFLGEFFRKSSLGKLPLVSCESRSEQSVGASEANARMIIIYWHGTIN